MLIIRIYVRNLVYIDDDEVMMKYFKNFTMKVFDEVFLNIEV